MLRVSEWEYEVGAGVEMERVTSESTRILRQNGKCCILCWRLYGQIALVILTATQNGRFKVASTLNVSCPCALKHMGLLQFVLRGQAYYLIDFYLYFITLSPGVSM